MKNANQERFSANNLGMITVTNLLARNRVDIDDLCEIIPGFLHINSIDQVRLQFCCKKTLDFLEIDRDEVIAEGQNVLKSVLHPATVSKIEKSLTDFGGHSYEIMTTFQQIRRNKCEDYKWYFSMKRKLNARETFSITQPVTNLGKSATLMKKFLDIEPWLEKKYALVETLTKREKEILKLVSRGKSSADISEMLFISKQTVSTHRKMILHKLQVSALTDLVRIADYFL